MHELSLACSLIEEAEKVLAAEKAQRATCLTIGIGKLSGIERDAFEFVFPMAAEGTRLENAEVTLLEIPVSIRCRECDKESNPEFPRCICLFCNSDDVELTGGRELTIQTMEIE